MNSNEQEKQSLIICGCTGTTQEKILTLIAQGFDLDKISSATGATSGCGACDAAIMDLVNEYTITL